MLRYVAVASGLLIGGLAFNAQLASAAPMSTPNQSLQTESMVEQVQYRYCRRWNRECRDRHGVGGDYRRCMRRHGC
jgi:hypothetical protein